MKLLKKFLIKRKIKKLNPWFYQIKIGEVETAPGIYSKNEKDISTEGLINRQKCRKKLLVDEIEKRFNFKNKTLLDLACNCGFWSSFYLKNFNALSLVGIEGRKKFIKQAKFYYKNISILNKAKFFKKDVRKFNYEKLNKNFDFILCCGILYHIKDQKSLLEKLSKINNECMVIDTRVDKEGRELKEEEFLCFNALKGTGIVKSPQKEKIVRIMEELGYEVEQLPVKFRTKKGIDGVDDYNKENRVCLFCKKCQPLQ